MQCDVMLSKGTVQDHARQIVAGLAGIDARHALQILTTALDLVVAQFRQDSNTLPKPVSHTATRILRPRGGISKVSKDPEIKAFIDSLDQPTTLRELRQNLIKSFGAGRVPSKSALHRYLQRRVEGE